YVFVVCLFLRWLFSERVSLHCSLLNHHLASSIAGQLPVFYDGGHGDHVANIAGVYWLCLSDI
ncbi:MAG: hypothetical protein KDH94_06525, partial [Coxiellaceae bacterium]|nr:hypothetical protein [Coxiellaceae bacterium]